MCKAGLHDLLRRIACVFLLFSGLTAVLQVSAFAASGVALTWNASTDANVVGYKIYYGQASGSYLNTTNVNNVTFFTVPNLVKDTPYYFVVTTYDANGLESIPSKEVENIPPRVNIQSPTVQEAEVATNTITLSGTAVDNVGVTDVRVTLNGRPFQNATVTSSNPSTVTWTTPLTLNAGTNIVQVKAVDSSGNETTANRSFFLRVSSPLVLVTNGSGSMTVFAPPPYYVGRTYTLKVKPSLNNLFSNAVANGTILYSAPPVTAAQTGTNVVFMMETNLTVVGNFPTNRFIGGAGTYHGLFSDADGVAHQSAGYIKFLLTKGLAFSGTMYVEGEAVALAGKFDLAGVGTLTKHVSRRGLTNEPINVVPIIDFANKQIKGTVSNGVWAAGIDTDLAVYNLINLPPMTGTTGQYTMVLPSSGLAGEPGGDGYATFKVTRSTISGAVSLAVHIDPLLLTSLSNFGDGERLTPVTGVPPSKNGRYPFYAKLYKYYRPATMPRIPPGTTNAFKGSVLGWLTFGSSNVVGDLVWNKIGWTNGLYNAGFSNEVTVVGSAYVPPALFQKVINLGSNAVVVLQGGGLGTPITNKFDWVLTGTGTNKLVWPTAGTTNNPNRISLTVSKADGRITGTFVPNTNAPTVKATVKAAVLQDANTARGNFKGTSASGSMLMYQP